MRSPSLPAQQRKARSTHRRVIFEYTGSPQPPSIQPVERLPPIFECGGKASAFLRIHQDQQTDFLNVHTHTKTCHPEPAPFAGEGSAFRPNRNLSKTKKATQKVAFRHKNILQTKFISSTSTRP
jgi:hypothetical protein